MNNVPLLEVSGLGIHLPSGTPLVTGSSFQINKGQTLGIVGESGSGKSMTALSILRLLPPGLRLNESTRILMNGTDLTQLSERELRHYRGERIGMIFQDPLASFNPIWNIGQQLKEALSEHGVPSKELKNKSHELLLEVGLNEPERIMKAYPHELSGGMLQRAMIAMALSGNPELLIADEPTSALDVTVQAKILNLLRRLQKTRNMGMLFISHDLAVVASLSHNVAVMSHGVIVEQGAVEKLFTHPCHPYTKSLLSNRRKITSTTDLDGTKTFQNSPLNSSEEPILSIKDVSISYPAPKLFMPSFNAVKKLSLNLTRGECLGIVGESGSGKTSLLRAIMGLVPLRSGTIQLFGLDRSHLSCRDRGKLSRDCQIIFQNSTGVLNPRLPIETIIREPMQVHGLPCSSEHILQLLEEVGLSSRHMRLYPHQLSGGQRQRVNIARALSLDPQLLLCDEILSALDASVQAQLIELINRIRSKRCMSMVFISHDLRVVRALCDTIAVMRQGKLVEYGSTCDIWNHPHEAYTQELLTALPSLSFPDGHPKLAVA